MAKGEDEGRVGSHTRYLILVISLLTLTSVRSNDLTFLFTVICMTGNSTTGPPDVPLTSIETTISFAGAGAGALVTSLALGALLHRLGARMVFAGVALASATATSLVPYAALEFGVPLIFPLRVIQGMAIGAVMPTIGFIVAHWAPTKEIGKFVTTLSAAGQLSQILTNPLSATLCVSAGWPYAYYLHASASLLMALCFFSFFRNSPNKHPAVSPEELKKITTGGVRRRKDEGVPYRHILRSKPVWAIWIAFFGNSFGYQLIQQFMPLYLHRVLRLPVEMTGMSAIVPPATQLVVKMMAGVVSDNITCISERRKLQMFNTIAMVGCGLSLLPLGYLPPGRPLPAILCFTSSISCLGLVTCGSMKNVTLLARQFSHVVMSAVQFVVCIGMLLVPFFVSILAPNNSSEEWRRVFFGLSVVLIITNCIFCAACSSDAAPWTRPGGADKAVGAWSSDKERPPSERPLVVPDAQSS